MLKFNSVLSLAAALLLTACGGGATLGDGSGGGLGGDGGGTTGPSSTPANITLVTSSTQLPADADTAAEGILLTAIVTDRNGNTVSNAVVAFALSSASKAAIVVGNATTGADGTATATLTTGGNSTFPRSVSIIASVGSVRSQPKTINVVDPNSVSVLPTVTLTASATRLDPGASSTAQGVTLTATVRNPDGSAAGNVLVTFNQTFAGSGTGTISPTSGRTNASGQLSAVLTTGGNSAPRSIIVTAQATTDDEDAGTAESQPVTVQVRSVQTATSVLLSGDRTVLSPLANTPDQGVQLTATVVGPNGQALAGVPVNFTASGVVIQVTQGVTDASGRAFAVATTGGNSTPRTATASASADGINSTPFVIEVRNAATLTLVPSSTQLSPTAETPAEGVVFTATLRDSNNAPLPNVQVSFTADSGQVQTTRSLTDNGGNATAVLTTGGDPSPRTILVTATATIGSQVLTATRSVSVVEQTASLTVLSASPTLPSGASAVANGVRITALVKDSGNNLVENVPVSFSSTGGGALQVVRGTTDATGTAEAVLTTGGDPTARTITVNASSGGISDSVQVVVSGSQMTISAPAAVSINTTDQITVAVRDSNNAPVSGRPVTLQSSQSSTINGQIGGASANTNAQGVATFNYMPTISGTDTITATAIGVSAPPVQISVAGVVLTLVFNPATPTEFNFGVPAPVRAELRNNGAPVAGATLQFSTTRGMLSATSGVTNGAGQVDFTVTANGSDGAGPFLVSAVAPANGGVSANISGEFIAINPTQVNIQAEPTKIGLNSSSTIRAIVRDASNNLVKNQRVNFVLTDPTGGSLSAASGITNSQGVVTTTYRSSSTSSAENGVRVRADLVNSGGAVLDSDEVRLTVGGTALRITLGTGNEIIEDNPTTYKLPYTAIVTDAAGNPAPASTVFRLKVTSLEYQKGRYVGPPPFVVQYNVDPLTDPAAGPRGFGCRNEDPDGSGIYVVANDDNGNGVLDPGNVATVPLTVDLDANGVADFEIIYPQDRANWVLVDLTATASVDGTESRETRRFVLPVLAEDVQGPGSPPGNPSPYGQATVCADPD